MSRREREEEHCGCTIDLRTGRVSVCEQCSERRRGAEVPASERSLSNAQRERRVIR